MIFDTNASLSEADLIRLYYRCSYKIKGKKNQLLLRF